MASHGADAMHGTSGPAAASTPARRPAEATGNSPVARRPRRIDPSHVNDAQAAPLLPSQTKVELTRMTVLHEARLLALEQWADESTAAMADHAEKIDVARIQLAGSQAFNETLQAVEGHEGSISTLGRAMAGTQAAVEQNDEKMKKMISDNDERFKADVVERDAKVKEHIANSS